MINFNAEELAEPIRIIVGASSQSYPGWIQTQEDELNILSRSDWEGSFKSKRRRCFNEKHF
jgi:predicted SAM-dependent methyltransferase